VALAVSGNWDARNFRRLRWDRCIRPG
jgi:hypothetical protein